MMNARSLHRILGLIVGAQLLIWTLTGLAFNLINDEYLSANTQRTKPTQASSLIQPQVTLSDIAAQTKADTITRIKLETLFDRPIYRVKLSDGTQAFWADTGEQVNLNHQQLTELAQQSYSGESQLSMPVLDKDAAQRYGGSQEFYRFDTQDQRGTQIFVDGNTGLVKAHENNGSQLKQLLFMLHFIDYFPNNGVSFNHVATQIIALAALLLGLSGAWLLVRKLLAGDYVSWRAKRQGQSLTLLSPDGEQLETIALTQDNLMDNLNHGQMRVPSQCGGGGHCGMCRIRFVDDAPPATPEEQDRLKEDQLAAGVRLSCQQKATHARLALTSRAQLRFWQKAQYEACEAQATSPSQRPT
ncbi:PepSY domain-containing protein [Shewanella sp.]|uniref:PepSY domain-containing protein n=1 Tax=Shewanella sp. TaxID=50422 RepID=UPI003D0F8A06